MSKPFRQRTYTMRSKEISDVLASYLARKHVLPTGDYDVRMETKVNTESVVIKITLKPVQEQS